MTGRRLGLVPPRRPFGLASLLGAADQTVAATNMTDKADNPSRLEVVSSSPSSHSTQPHIRKVRDGHLPVSRVSIVMSLPLALQYEPSPVVGVRPLLALSQFELGRL